MTLSGPSDATTCLTFKTPPAASPYAGMPQVLLFWIYKIQSPLSVLEFYGTFRTTGIPLEPNYDKSQFIRLLTNSKHVFLLLNISSIRRIMILDM